MTFLRQVFRALGAPSTLVRAAAASLLLCGLNACKREERLFHAPVDAQKAQAVQSLRLSTLQPGVPSPAPPAKNGDEDNAQALAEGKRLFSSFNCTGCHANGGGDKGPALMDAKWIYGSRPEQIFSSIMDGRPNGMPSFKGKVPEGQAWQIVAYVRSLSGQVPKDAATSRSDEGQPSGKLRRS
jgi:cytochrome c oxidase cbb3-type subunit III